MHVLVVAATISIIFASARPRIVWHFGTSLLSHFNNHFPGEPGL